MLDDPEMKELAEEELPALKARLPDRVTVVEIANAGHALLPEQPERVRDTILGHIGAL